MVFKKLKEASKRVDQILREELADPNDELARKRRAREQSKPS